MAVTAVLGRDAELERIATLVASLTRGPAALVIDGEAGAGKTAVWAEAVDRARLAAAVLISRPVESEMALAYAALGDLLGGVLDPVLVDLPAPQRRALEVALRLDDGIGASTDHRAVAAAVLSVLRALARTRPVVVAIDDLQWLDRPSARAIGFAFRRLSDEPVGLVATMRTPDAGAPPELGDLLRDRRVQRLRVGPMSLGSTQHLVTERLGLVLPRTALIALHDSARGNPYLALEIGRALVDAGSLPAPGEPLPVPGDLRTLLVQRVHRLPRATRDALLVVALLPDAQEPVLAHAVGEGWEVAVARGREAGIIEVRGSTVRFAHPLLAAAVVGDASERERRDAHGRLAGAVQDDGQRARHLALAASGPDAATAEALEAAAAQSSRRGAPDLAADLADLAVRLTPTGRPHDRCRRCVLAGEARFAAGDSSRALDRFAEALGVAATGAERAQALWHLGRVHYQHDDIGAARTHLDDAANEAGDDPGLLAAIHQDLAYVHLSTGNVGTTLDHIRTAVELADRAGAVEVLAEALAQVAVIEFMTGSGLREDLMDRARALEDWEHPCPALRRPTIAVSRVLVWADRLDEARALVEVAERELRDRGDAGALPFLGSQAAELDCWTGQWERGWERALEADREATQTGQDGSRPVTAYVVALLAAHRGGEADARAAVEAGVAVSESTGQPIGVALNLGVLGFLELSLGHPDRTHEILGPVLAASRAGGVDEPAVAWWLPDEIEALVALGENDLAASLTGWIEVRGRAIDHPTGLAVAARSRALLAAAEGAVDEALAACGEALAHHDRVDRPFPRARTLLVKGQIERRARRWGQARGSLEGALGAFEALGATLWADRARQGLARVGGRPPPDQELSDSERQVAELVATGRTNREVAVELFLSPKTVSATLGRVYRKLGVTSRTEMAERLRTDPPPS